jgi:hypothetical protein
MMSDGLKRSADFHSGKQGGKTMKKRALLLTACLSAVILASACTNGNAQTEPAVDAPIVDDNGSEESGNTEESGDPAEVDVNDADDSQGTDAPVDGGSAENAADIYESFINGEISAVTGDYFSDTDNYPALEAGSYDFGTLKATAENIECGECDTDYTTVTSADGGAELMVVRFATKDENLLNYYAVLCAKADGTLEITYEYEDGYRSYSALFENGYVEVGGSAGAGAQVSSVYMLNSDGSATAAYTLNYFWGSFSEQIAYDINPEIDYNNIPLMDPESEAQVMEYVENGEVYFAVTAWTEDEDIHEGEKTFFEALEGMGAHMVEQEDIESMKAKYALPAEGSVW